MRMLWLPLLWLATAGLMIRDWIVDPYDPTLEGSRAYGHNHEGALTTGLVLLAIELVILLAILRPWSYRRSWGRALAATVWSVPWTALSTIAGIHAGGVMTLHALWMFVLVAALGVMFVWSVVAAIRAR